MARPTTYRGLFDFEMPPRYTSDDVASFEQRRCLTMLVASLLKLHVDDACAYRRLQRGMVLLGLVGICERNLAHRLVEIISLAEIAADHPGIACLCMGPRQDPAARLAVRTRKCTLCPVHKNKDGIQ